MLPVMELKPEAPEVLPMIGLDPVENNPLTSVRTNAGYTLAEAPPKFS